MEIENEEKEYIVDERIRHGEELIFSFEKGASMGMTFMSNLIKNAIDKFLESEVNNAAHTLSEGVFKKRD